MAMFGDSEIGYSPQGRWPTIGQAASETQRGSMPNLIRRLLGFAGVTLSRKVDIKGTRKSCTPTQLHTNAVAKLRSQVDVIITSAEC